MYGVSFFFFYTENTKEKEKTNDIKEEAKQDVPHDDGQKLPLPNFTNAVKISLANGDSHGVWSMACILIMNHLV